MFFSSIEEINRLTSKGRSSQNFDFHFHRKENLKKCTCFEEEKGQGIFGETFILALWSSAVFHLQN